MNKRQRLEAVLAGERCDKIPWYADLSYLYSGMQTQGRLEARYGGEAGYLYFHRELGAGICFYAPQLWQEQHGSAITLQSSKQGYLRLTTYKTPLGTLREVQQYMPLAWTWAIVEHFVKDLTDLRVMLYIMQQRAILADYAPFAAVDAFWGEDGYAVGLAPLGVAPLQRLLTRWAGVPTTMELYMDHREELEAIFVELEAADDSIFTALCTSPCRLIEFPENLSAQITSRRFFESYNVPCYWRRVSQLHAAGIRVSIHNDGTLRGTFDLLAACGFDVVEAITPAPVGDIALDHLREAVGPGVVIWGGLPGVLFSPCYHADEFEEHLQQAVKIFKADGHCVLGVADQVPPDGEFARIRRVREVVEA